MNPSLSFIEGIGGPELMLIMFIVLLLFGANKLPELARGMGKAVREFKKATSSVETEMRRAMEEPPAPPAPPSPRPAGTVVQQGEPEKPTLPPTAD
jgi:sec-independent protein translocase protein TatA